MDVECARCILIGLAASEESIGRSFRSNATFLSCGDAYGYTTSLTEG